MLHIRSALKRNRISTFSARYSRATINRNAAYSAKEFVPNENGPNIRIIRWLTKEMENENLSDAENGPYKARALQRACKAIDALPEPITSGEDALKIVGVGGGIARRIDDYLSKGSEFTISKPPPSQKKSPEEIEREKCLKEFRRVPGIGPVKAEKLYVAGCRSLDDLRKPEYSKNLSTPSRSALDYVDHLGERVTRAEIDVVLQNNRPSLSSEIRMYAVGSYRRGLATCSDIDLIFFHPSCVHVPRPGEKMLNDPPSSVSNSKRRGRPPKQEREGTLLRDLVLTPLERAGVLAATLTEGPRKWQGIARIRKVNGSGGAMASIYRRMDLSLYPTLSEGAALLATTGDADFNAYVRRNASKLGLLLNEFGLWKFCRHSPPDISTYEKENSDTDTDGHWELVASKTEREVLDSLGVEYVEPDRRNFSFVVSRSKQGKGTLFKSRGRAVSTSELRRGKPK